MNSITPIISRKISEPTSDTQSFKKNKFLGISFKSKKTQIVDEFSKSILKNLEQSSKTDESLKKIFADENKTKTFMGVLGGLITSVAAGITELLHNNDDPKEDFIDVFSKEVKPIEHGSKKTKTTTTNSTNKKTKSAKKVTPKELLNECKCVRGRKSNLEKEILGIIEKNETLSIDEKVVLVELFNKFCGLKRNDVQIIDGKKVPNTEIAMQLCEDLKKNNYENANEIFKHYQDNTFSLGGKPETKVQQNNTNKLNEIAIECEPIVSKKFMTQLNTTFKDYKKEFAELGETLSKDDAMIVIAYIANNSISQKDFKIWYDKFKDSKISFPKYINLIHNGVEADSLQIEIINSLIEKKKLADISVNKAYGDFNINLAFPAENSIKENFKTISDIFEIIKDERISIEPKFPIRADKENIIEELKLDYKTQNFRTTTYPKLIKFLYGSQHKIYSIHNFDTNMKNPRIKELVNSRMQLLSKILNNPRIFDPEIFDLHSAMRFLERFVFDGNVDYQQIETIIRNEIGIFNTALRNSLRQGIDVVTYETNDKIAPQFKIKNEIGDNVTITLDKGGRIHTIY